MTQHTAEQPPRQRVAPTFTTEAPGRCEVLAAAAPSTANRETRTVDVMFYSGAPVSRYSWVRDEEYMLGFDMTEEAFDLSLLNNGAPVLDAHNRFSNEDRVGVIEKAWLADGQAYATLRFSDRADVEPLWQDVLSGIARKFSMGVYIDRIELREQEEGALPLYVCTAARPYEISPVPIAADMATTTLSADPAEAAEVPAATEGQTQTEETMTDQRTPEGEAAPRPVEAEATPVQLSEERVAEIASLAVERENQRIRGIRTSASKLSGAGITELAEQLMGDTTVDLAAARDQLFEAASLADGPDTRPQHQAATMVADHADKFAASLENAVGCRVKVLGELKDEARELRGMSLMEQAREYVRVHRIRVQDPSNKLLIAGAALSHRLGGEVSRPSELLAPGMHSTSDFANILANVANKRLLDSYETTPRTFMPWTREIDLPDFKTAKITRRTALPTMGLVTEGAKFQYVTFGDTGEDYALGTYGFLVAITRQTVINDDLRALDELPDAIGMAAADTESDVVYAVVTNNAALADAVALFHGTHANLADGTPAVVGAPSIINIGGMGTMLGLQTENGRPLNLELEHLVIPKTLEFGTQQIFAQFQAATVATARPGTLMALRDNIHAEGRLDLTSTQEWYGFASPRRAAVIARGHLDGQAGPLVERKDGWDVDGIELKGRNDFGAGAVGYHGGVKNPG